MYGDNSPLDAHASTASLTLTPIDAGYLRTAGKWGRFISITGIIIIALGVLIALVSGGVMASTLGSTGIAGLGLSGIFILMYVVFFAIFLYLYISMYQFSTNAIVAADRANPEAMTVAFRSLSRMFQTVGILFIIYFAFVVLTFLVTLVGGVGSFL